MTDASEEPSDDEVEFAEVVAEVNRETGEITERTPSTAVEVRNETAALPDYAILWKLASVVCRTPFAMGFRGDRAASFAAMARGVEVGLSPMQSLCYVNVIAGKPVLTAEGMRALVLGAGHSIRIVEDTNDHATVVGRRRDNGDEYQKTYTFDDAKRAGLTSKENWSKHPAAMLVARASSAVCRGLFPDVIAGLSYSAEELSDEVEEADAVYG